MLITISVYSDDKMLKTEFMAIKTSRTKLMTIKAYTVV